MPFVIYKFKSKNGASVSEEFALFNLHYQRKGEVQLLVYVSQIHMMAKRVNLISNVSN